MKCRSTSIQSNQTPDIQIARRDFFYVSNILSLFRLLLTPLIFYSIKQRHSVGILTFGSLAILSDALDGFLARRLNQSSELGKNFRPHCGQNRNRCCSFRSCIKFHFSTLGFRYYYHPGYLNPPW
jgi:hypothetical protein